jgi:PPK2 family polyphosphate:nucleotide phosphotransferase
LVGSRFRVTTLQDTDPGSTKGGPGKREAREFVAAQAEWLRDQQTRLLADAQRSILLVLQGMDGCGKDGVVRHVIDQLYPTNVRVAAFKTPTDEEKQHDFLWRFRPHLPAPGSIAVFNRSWYEDVGIVKVHGLVPPEVIEERYGLINAFERELADSGTVVVKVFLRLSYEEQADRMLGRLTDPTKLWKFNEGDLRERAFWPSYMDVYDEAIRRCSAVPWHVVPADHKWYRDWVLVQLLREAFEGLSLEYPKRPDLAVDALIKRVKAS